MSDNRLNVLRMLSSVSKSDWKIGKSDDFIKAVSSKIGMLPAGVFDSFSIDANGDKKISVVDFALMTYEMSDVDKNSLMSLYDIDSGTIKSILNAADEIAEIFEAQSQEFAFEEKNLNHSLSSTHKALNTSRNAIDDDFDEI